MGLCQSNSAASTTASDYNAADVWGNYDDYGKNDYEKSPSHEHHDHGHHGHDHHGGHHMAMNFHFNHENILYLFEFAKIECGNHLILYSFITVAIGILVEYMKVYRLRLAANVTGWNHVLDATLYLIQSSLAYCLMLIAMTYHYLLFFAVVFGMALGYYMFNGQKQDPEFTEARRKESLKGDCC